MLIALSCPYCQKRPMRTARNVTYVRSALWGNPQYSKTYLAGCGQCVWLRVVRTVARNVFEVPAGLVTRTIGVLNLVTIVPQNLFAVLWPGTESHKQKCMAVYLYNEGMVLEDVVIGGDGLTQTDRGLALRLAAVLRGAAAADGEVAPEEIAAAAEAIVALTDGRCSRELASALLTDVPDEPPPLAGFDYARRIALMRSAMRTVAADHVVSDDEREFVSRLGQELELPEEFVSRLLAGPLDESLPVMPKTDDPDVLSLACLTLGVDAAAPLPTIKQRYGELAVQVNPVTAGWSASTAANEGPDAHTFVPSESEARRLEWAYAILRRRAITAEMPAAKKGVRAPSPLAHEQARTSRPVKPARPRAALGKSEGDDTPSAELRSLMAQRRRWRRALPWALLGFPILIVLMVAGLAPVDYAGTMLLVVVLASPVIIARLWTLFRMRPRVVLLLRPFSEPAVNDTLVRVVRERLGYLGFVFTLADADVVDAERRQRFLGAIPVLSLFAPVRFGARTRMEIAQLAEGLKQLMRRTYGWLFSRRRLFVIPASDAVWREAVQLLIDTADVVLVEISETAPGVVWEFEQLRHSPAGAGVVFLARPDRKENAQRSADHFFHQRASEIFSYEANGALTDEVGFVRAVARGLVDRGMMPGTEARPKPALEAGAAAS